MIDLLRKVSPDTSTRDAAAEAQRLWSAAEAERMVSHGQLHILMKAIDKGAPRLDQEDEKLAGELLKEYGQPGRTELSQVHMEEFRETGKQITDLCNQFQQNLRNEKDGLFFTTEDLSGVPHRLLDRPGDSVENRHAQKHFVPFSTTQYYTVMKFADKPETRKRLYIANARRLPQNVPLFREIITLRDRNARLLGYAHHAERVIVESRLARSPGWVDDFLGRLQEALLPLAEKEMEVLRARKVKHLAESGRGHLSFEREILPWDVDYYTRILEEEEGVDQTAIAEYFPLQTTIPATLDLFSRLFGLEFAPIPTSEKMGCIWHDDVEIWAVWNGGQTTGEFLGYLYLDLLQRPGKLQAEQNLTLQSGFQQLHGGRTYPSTVLLCGFARPSATDQTLLNHREVKTVFHELGHAVHDLLGRTKYARFSGANTSRDFVETPSLLLENWAWMGDILTEISCHVAHLDPSSTEKWRREHPGVPIPPYKIPNEMLRGLAKVRTLNKARKMLSGVAFAKYDMAIHSLGTHEECLAMDETALLHDLQEELTLCRHPDRDNRGHPHTTISHLVGSYDVGYYSYSCAQAFADDMFCHAFANDPYDKTAWKKYKEGILEYGGSRNELDMLEEFLGRPVDAEASLWSLSRSL